jgi:hypothetical protein
MSRKEQHSTIYLQPNHKENSKIQKIKHWIKPDKMLKSQSIKQKKTFQRMLSKSPIYKKEQLMQPETLRTITLSSKKK